MSHVKHEMATRGRSLLKGFKYCSLGLNVCLVYTRVFPVGKDCTPVVCQVLIQRDEVLLSLENPLQQVQVLRVIDAEPRGQDLSVDVILVDVGLQTRHSRHAHLCEENQC